MGGVVLVWKDDDDGLAWIGWFAHGSIYKGGRWREGLLTSEEEESPCGAEEEEGGFIRDSGGMSVCAVPGCYCLRVSLFICQ